MEFFRDQAIERFEGLQRVYWRPRSGSLVSHRSLTSAVIDFRFPCRKTPRRDGGGAADRTQDCPDRWARLQRPPSGLRQDRPRRMPSIPTWRCSTAVSKGRRADCRPMGQSPQGTANRFQTRLDQICQGRTLQAQRSVLDVLPIGVMVFPGTGIQQNMADKARKFGIPIWKFGNGGA